MKFQSNLPYLGYNTVLRTLEIRHYGPVCDVSETGLYEVRYDSIINIARNLLAQSIMVKNTQC